MSSGYLGIVILLPILGGFLEALLPFRSRKARLVFTELVVLINAILVWILIANRPSGAFELFRITGNLTISFQMDSLAVVFAGLVSALWPLATLYAFEYMEHEEHETAFYMFYVMTFGVTLGIALAENYVTMYCFYEMLTIVTIPLVIHELSREAIQAGRTYLYYSMGGAAFGFIGLIFVMFYGTTTSFIPGGVFNLAVLPNGIKATLQWIFVMTFCGFSVKAAMFPFSAWLPKAGVAPTPVTALLHAVAVVKAGAFAIMRVTYYCFGTELLRGSIAQYIVMALTVFTIVYGCSRAVKETHTKRRLAWSTVSNLSYILFGVTIMTPIGLQAALTHMLFHAVMKICAFFCAGVVLCKTGREFVYQVDGLGRKMPITFFCFTISGLALMGVPGFCGFVSKWNLVKAAIESEGALASIGVAALLISALLTAIYMTSVSVRAFFPGADFDYSTVEGIHDPSWKMLLPLILFVIFMLIFGIFGDRVFDLLGNVTALL